MTSPQTGPQLALGRLVVERLTFDHRADWVSGAPKSRPDLGEVNLGYEVRGEEADGAFLARLSIRCGGEGSDYTLDATVSGVFQKVADGEGALTRTGAARAAAAILFPFLREIVANITMRGAFGAALLQPVNVVGLLEEAKGDAESPAPVRSEE